MRRVVVTGLGFVSPIGHDKDSLVESLKTGKSGIREISLFHDPDLDVYLAGECRDFRGQDHFSKKEIRRLDRVNLFGLVAARQAVQDGGVDLEDYKSDRVGVMISSGIGGLGTIEKESQKAFEKDFSKISPFFIPMVIANMTSAHVSIDLGIHGYVGCPITACASSSNAILDAYRSIKDGYNDLVLAGGAEASINRLGIGGFHSMKALSKSQDPERGSIPFDKERDGFVMGEGAGVLVLEDMEVAEKRGARIYAEIIGGHMTSDASHITAPDEEGKYASLAMEKAASQGWEKLLGAWTGPRGSTPYLIIMTTGRC